MSTIESLKSTLKANRYNELKTAFQTLQTQVSFIPEELRQQIEQEVITVYIQKPFFPAHPVITCARLTYYYGVQKRPTFSKKQCAALFKLNKSSITTRNLHSLEKIFIILDKEINQVYIEFEREKVRQRKRQTERQIKRKQNSQNKE